MFHEPKALFDNMSDNPARRKLTVAWILKVTSTFMRRNVEESIVFNAVCENLMHRRDGSEH